MNTKLDICDNPILLHVHTAKEGYHLQIQQDHQVWQSRLLDEKELEFYLKEMVIAILSFRQLRLELPEAKQITKELKSGLGISYNHRQLIERKNGKDTVIEENSRFIIAGQLKLKLAKIMLLNGHLNGEV